MKPIIFNSEMVRAILEGRKTQTREIIKNLDGVYRYIEYPYRRVQGYKVKYQDQVGASHDLPCPYGEVWDRLWVQFVHKATTPDKSRITLEITGIRVEPLQDITEKDAVAEGCRADYGLSPGTPYDPPEYVGHSAVEDFAGLWESINGDGSWGENPFVWVVEFERVLS